MLFSILSAPPPDLIPGYASDYPCIHIVIYDENTCLEAKNFVKFPKRTLGTFPRLIQLPCHSKDPNEIISLNQLKCNLSKIMSLFTIYIQAKMYV